MNELIPISERRIGGDQVGTVNARALHAFLGIARDFNQWLRDGIDRARLVEGRDYVSYEDVANPSGGRPRKESALTIDAAKHIAMMSGSEKGFQVREYFMECERIAKAAPAPAINLDDPKFLRTVLLEYTEKVLELQQTVEAQKPAVEFAHAVRNTEDGIGIGDMARLLGTGQNRLFRRLREDHILMPTNRPYQQYLDRDYFRVIENVWFDAAKEPHPTFRTLVTGRGQVYLQRKYGAEAA